MEKQRRKPGPKPKEKVDIPQVPAPEKVEMPKAPRPDKIAIENELDYWLSRHHYPNGHKREIKAIIKPLL